MFNKSQTLIKEGRVLNIQRMALKQIKRPKNLKSPFNTTKKKFTPRINSSFAEYDEAYSPKVRFRSSSVDRSRRFSEIPLNITLNSMNEEPAAMLLASGKKEMQDNSFLKAAEKFNSVLLLTDSLEALYNRGVCYLNLKNFKEAVVDFLNVIKENSVFSKGAYLQLAVCFQNMNDPDAALRYVSQAIHRFSRFDEAVLIRARLYSGKKNWEKARLDYKKYLKYNANDEQALVGFAETYEKQGDYNTALKVLNESSSLVVLIKKARLFFVLGQFEQTLRTADAVVQKFPNAEAYFLKAEAHNKLSQFIEATLSYEQCIKYDYDTDFTSKSLFNVGALKIRERDFYGALHTFQRCTKNKTHEQRVLEAFSEAVISLMKREYKDGIKVFNKLIKSKDQAIEEHISSCYCYRAYGYLAINCYDKAILSLKKAGFNKSLDKASLYNQELAYALLYASKLDFDRSNNRLENAMKIFHRKSEPYIYKSSFLIFNAFKDDSVNIADILQAETFLEIAVSLREPDSEILFYRAITRYLRNNFSESLEDVKECIEKAEDNISEHYILRGLCYASLKVYKEAMQDFSIALQLNEKNYQVYSYRGRCAYMIDDTSLAFSDFQKFVAHNNNDYKVHMQAAVLLMSAGSYEDALRALENSISLQYTVKANYLTAKCYIIQGNIPGAVFELKKILKNDNFAKAKIDLEILNFLHGFLPSKDSFEEGIEYWES